MPLLRTLVGKLPKRFVSFVGTLQFRYPVLAPLMRKAAAQIAAGEGTIQSGLGKGLKMDATGGYAGYLLGTTEPLEQEVLGRYLKAGHVFYDIGANIGFYTVIGAHLAGEMGHVYAFEPFPEAIASVCKNVALNAFTNVTVEEAAVSDTEGFVRFALDEQSAKNKISKDGQTASNGDAAKDAPSIEVRLLSIDTYRRATKARLPDVVMIDVEGAEVDVLRGMKETLRESRPVILCEVHWLGEKMEACFNELLKPLDYHIATYDGKDLPEGSVRYHALLVPREKLISASASG